MLALLPNEREEPCEVLWLEEDVRVDERAADGLHVGETPAVDGQVDHDVKELVNLADGLVVHHRGNLQRLESARCRKVLDAAYGRIVGAGMTAHGVMRRSRAVNAD